MRREALDNAVLAHLGDQLFTEDRCQELLRGVIGSEAELRQRLSEQRRQLGAQAADLDQRIRRWCEAFEAGGDIAELGADRLRALRAEREDVERQLAATATAAPAPLPPSSPTSRRAFGSGSRRSWPTSRTAWPVSTSGASWIASCSPTVTWWLGARPRPPWRSWPNLAATRRSHPPRRKFVHASWVGAPTPTQVRTFRVGFGSTGPEGGRSRGRRRRSRRGSSGCWRRPRSGRGCLARVGSSRGPGSRAGRRCRRCG